MWNKMKNRMQSVTGVKNTKYTHKETRIRLRTDPGLVALLRHPATKQIRPIL